VKVWNPAARRVLTRRYNSRVYGLIWRTFFLSRTELKSFKIRDLIEDLN
jgi:hypothetical protein